MVKRNTARPANGPGRPRRALSIVLLGAVLGATALAVATATPAAAGPPTVMTAYVPLPADDLVTSFKAINAAAGTTLDFTVGVTNATDGAIITYDHWEDGYEADISNPVQASTEVWGDGNAGNGDASSYCSTCGGDLLTAGDVFVLRNNVDTPRDPGTIRWDGRDKIGSTRGFALTAGGWTTAIGSVLASAVSAFDTSRYGLTYVVPVGQDTPVPAGSTPPFEYSSAHIIASQADTTVQVDKNHDGTYDQTQTIDAGESMFVNGGLLEGARIVADKPVQVHLVTGDVGATYEAHTFSLFPNSLLANTYINPVGSSVVNQETIIYLFNPNGSAITVTPTCPSCVGTINVPAGTSQSFKVPLGEAVRFDSGGLDFVAVGAMGSQSGSGGAGGDASSTYDWGFTLVPADILTNQVVIGWAPGASDVPPSNATYDPVWMTSFAPTTLHIDYDGDPSTGAMGADCIGQHDAEIPVGALVSTRVTDSGDKSMTGARIYTCDGTAIAGAWGEDPANAPAGSPGLDAGYTIIPSAAMLVNKSSAVAIDANGDNKIGPGDTIQYTVTISNLGGIALTSVHVDDSLMTGLGYVPGSTTYDDGVVQPIPDDGPPAATAFPLDEGGLALPNLASGNTGYLRFRTTIADPFPGSDALISNRIDVTTDQGGGTSTDDQNAISADLSLQKTETASPTYVGDNAVFHLQVSNGGPDAAPGVEVTDLLPAGLTFQSATASQGTYDDLTGIWSVGTIANGADATLDITARVDSVSVTNDAQVTHSGAIDPDSQPAEDPLGPGNPPNQDDEDRVSVTVAPRADLSLVKTRVAGPDAQGATTFRIQVTNAGPSTATGVQVADLPPGGATFASATPSQGTFDDVTNTWVVGGVGAGQQATLDVTYTIPSFPATNYAQVSVVNESDPDSSPAEDALGPGNPPNQDDESSVTVSPSSDLSLTKDETASPSFVGDNAVFDLAVTNHGPDVATSVKVTDLLPAGLAYVSDTPSKGTYDPGTGVWDIGAIDVDATETLQLVARVTAPGSITNTAEVSASGAPDPDSTPDNGVPGEDDQAGASADTTGGSLGDTVFYDVDGDGSLDPGEPGLPGVTVTVTDAGPNGTLGDGDDVTLPPVTTDASGNWSVTGLGPGPYQVNVDPASLPSGITAPTADLDGTGSANVATLTLGSGEARADVDFGYRGTATVGDTTFLDDNGNGLIDTGEGLGGVRMVATWAGLDGVLGTGDDVASVTTTDASGTWTLPGLAAGSYRIDVDTATLPPGLSNSFDPDGGNDNASQLTLTPGVSDLTQDFGYLGTGTISRVIFDDINGNGSPDPGEGLAGVTVHVTWAGPDGVFGNADDRTYVSTTDADGLFQVGNLPAGRMRVDVMADTLPPGATNVVDPDGGNDGTSTLDLGAGQSVEQNFGYAVPADAPSDPPDDGPDAQPVATDPPPAAAPAETVAGALAFTGSSVVPRLSLAAVILLGAGVALVVTTRTRRRTRQAT